MKNYSPLFIILMLCSATNIACPQQAIIKAIKQSGSYALLQNGLTTPDINIERFWNGDFCTTTLHNTGQKDLAVKEVVILQAGRLFDSSTHFYAEGFQMLTQYKGTLGTPKSLGYFDDSRHYNMPQPQGYKVVYNMLILNTGNSNELLMGFNSSYRYIGKFYLNADTVKVVMDMDNTIIKAGASLKLEEFSLLTGNDVNALTSRFASRINYFHPAPALHKKIPDGWCSWYCFGPDVTAKNIIDNLTYIKANIPGLKYIQLDDGYQTHMGDWLETGQYFNGDIKSILHQIKASGFEPAIWVAPFICDSNSSVYKQHPDWLVKDSTGLPLRSDKVGFGGWRLGPWYVLDGTNPAVQQHLTHVFKTMSQEWGCTYFKLDANYWGAIHGGVYYDKNATRVTAYRSGMQAIIKGAGNAFILGCNHPLWPSLGLIDGSRSSNDIFREWRSFAGTAEENLLRAWQNGKLWWNDPDCLLLTGELPENEFMYHASVIFATGGMKLSGDDLTKISPKHLEILKKAMLPVSTAKFNNTMDVGWVKKGDTTFVILLNNTNETKETNVPLIKGYTVINYWTGEIKGAYKNNFTEELAPHTGRVYMLLPIKVIAAFQSSFK